MSIAPVINMPNTQKHNGVRFPTQLLVLHSAESPLRGGFAQSLTEWANTPLSAGGPVASWQRFVDPIARVRMVPDHLAAWHASHANPMSIGWEQAGYAAYTRDQWLTPEGRKQLENLAYDMAEVALRDGIPLVWLETSQVNAVQHGGNRTIKGFCIHAQVDPHNRTDPGQGYPYDILTERIAHYMGAGSQPDPAPAPEPAPSPTEEQELEMALSKDTLLQMQTAFRSAANRKWLQDTLMLAKARSSDGKFWSVAAHLEGTARRTTQTQEALVRISAELAGVREELRQLAAATGAKTDQNAVRSAVAGGRDEALVEAERKEAALVAELEADEQEREAAAAAADAEYQDQETGQ